MPKFEIITPVWSRQHGRQLEPGEVVEFTDNPAVPEDAPVDPDLIIVDFEGLTKAGVMVPIKSKKKEVTDNG